jgi:hypothetical protein
VGQAFQPARTIRQAGRPAPKDVETVSLKIDSLSPKSYHNMLKGSFALRNLSKITNRAGVCKEKGQGKGKE